MAIKASTVPCWRERVAVNRHLNTLPGFVAQHRARQVSSNFMRTYPRLFSRFIITAIFLFLAGSLPASDDGGTISIDQIQPGMKGIAYTIFSGDKIEPMDLEVIGILHNALGPKQDVILVQMHGEKVEHSGIVAGMSGSPVYFNGKLAGALSLKLGVFTKEAIGGVTPIASILDIQNALPGLPGALPATPTSAGGPQPFAGSTQSALRISIPADILQRAPFGAGNYLQAIETPLMSTGISPAVLGQFQSQFTALGMATALGGTDAPSPEDANIKPGDMVGMQLVGGDLSLTAGCTVTAIVGDRVFACGHPLFGFGNVSLPLLRGHVVMTLNSDMASTKIMSTTGVIGTLTEDRTTAVMGRLGAAPPMIPMDVSITTPQEEKRFHFDVAEVRQLTPILVAIATQNGISTNTAYSEGTTLEVTGTIDLKDHAPAKIEDYYAPTDAPAPGGTQVAFDVLNIFTQIYNNPYEPAHVQKITINVKLVPERRSASIESAWSEKSEVEPGETIRVKVLLRPYRGDAFIQEVPVIIPPQAARGSLQLLVCDAETLNRMTQSFGAASQLAGLDELVALLNRERHNDRLYAALLQSSPTLLVEDKELPNVPLSQINILDQRRNPGGARLIGQSSAGEWSVGMNRVITGQRALTITVK
jgi:SpoIVB peptidase S55